MATIIYLWDGGSNTSPYDTWAKAATTYATAAADWSTSDEVIYMAQDHQETAAGLTLTGATGDAASDRVRIWSMERTGTTYAPQTSTYNFQSTGAGNTLLISDKWDAHGIYLERTPTVSIWKPQTRTLIQPQAIYLPIVRSKSQHPPRIDNWRLTSLVSSNPANSSSVAAITTATSRTAKAACTWIWSGLDAATVRPM
jgi:hypothetical protein